MHNIQVLQQSCFQISSTTSVMPSKTAFTKRRIPIQTPGRQAGDFPALEFRLVRRHSSSSSISRKCPPRTGERRRHPSGRSGSFPPSESHQRSSSIRTTENVAYAWRTTTWTTLSPGCPVRTSFTRIASWIGWRTMAAPAPSAGTSWRRTTRSTRRGGWSG